MNLLLHLSIVASAEMFLSSSSYCFCQASCVEVTLSSQCCGWLYLYTCNLPMSSSIEPAFSTRAVLTFSSIRTFKLFAERRKRGILLNLGEENWRKFNNH